MKIIFASIVVLTPLTTDLLKEVERAGRTCYRSEKQITSDSAEKFFRMLRDRGHEAMLEHADVSICFTCDRGVTHEAVRHRIASYAQESTRYCDYSSGKFGGEITYIDIKTGMQLDKKQYTEEQINAILQEWLEACMDAERHYMRMIELGASPQIARSVLNNSTRTQIVIKMNLREWRHFLKLRCAPDAHPQMREVAYMVYHEFLENLPVVVEDIFI